MCIPIYIYINKMNHSFLLSKNFSLHLKCWCSPFSSYSIILFLSHLLLCHPMVTFLPNTYIQMRPFLYVLNSPMQLLTWMLFCDHTPPQTHPAPSELPFPADAAPFHFCQWFHQPETTHSSLHSRALGPKLFHGCQLAWPHSHPQCGRMGPIVGSGLIRSG